MMMLLRVQKELRDRLGQKHLNELLSSFNDIESLVEHLNSVGRTAWNAQPDEKVVFSRYTLKISS